MTRNKLIENITLIKHENNKHNKLNLVKDAVCEGEKEFLELEDEYSKMLKDEQNKGYLMKLEEQNLAQRRKAIILEREHDNFKSKLKEKEMEL